MSNARIWVWHKNGAVKLTLRPGETATMEDSDDCGGEGFYWSQVKIHHAGTHLIRFYESSSRDCDGPHSSQVVYVCQRYTGEFKKVKKRAGLEFPVWEQKSYEQRDVFAEMLNY